MSDRAAGRDPNIPFRARIKSFYWDDLPEDHNFDRRVNLRMLIGPLGAEGGESFDISICTIDAVRSQLDVEGVVFGRHLLIVDGVNPARIEATLNDRISRISGKTWNEVAEKIARIAYWEFEDYSAGC